MLLTKLMVLVCFVLLMYKPAKLNVLTVSLLYLVGTGRPWARQIVWLKAYLYVCYITCKCHQPGTDNNDFIMS